MSLKTFSHGMRITDQKKPLNIIILSMEEVMKPYNIGIIGIGDISDKYIKNLKKFEIVNVLACASRGLDKAKKVAEKFSIPRPYASGAEVIADPDVDIILNLSPPAVHSEYNIAALKAGKHIYSEKPLGSDLESAGEIMKLAEKQKLYVGCAPDTFMGGRLQTCRKLLNDGTIGRVIGAGAYCVYHGVDTFHNSPFFYFKEGAGPLLDIGPYYMTALLSLLGPVRRCSAMANRAESTREILGGPYKGETLDVEVDTNVMGNLEFHNGAIASMITSFDVWDSEMPRIEIYGTEGTLCINDPDPLDGPNLFGGPLLLRTRKEYRWYDFPRDKNPPEWIEVPIEHRFNSTSHQDNHRGIGLIDMAYAIRNGRKHRASGEMAYHSMEVMTKMLRSAKENRFFEMESSFTLPAPLPVDFPDQEK
jgi:predicted dehydrogenase